MGSRDFFYLIKKIPFLKCLFKHWWEGVGRKERRNKGREQTPNGREGSDLQMKPEESASDRKRDSSSTGTEGNLERKVRTQVHLQVWGLYAY